MIRLASTFKTNQDPMIQGNAAPGNSSRAKQLMRRAMLRFTPDLSLRCLKLGSPDHLFSSALVPLSRTAPPECFQVCRCGRKADDTWSIAPAILGWMTCQFTPVPAHLSLLLLLKKVRSQLGVWAA